MENLASASDSITVVHEELLHGRRRDLRFFGKPGVEIRTRLEGIDTVIEARPGRAALRRVAIGLRKKHTTPGESIHVW